MSITATVTGLNYSEIKSDIRSFMLGALGTEITILAEEVNPFDRFALLVADRHRRHVGRIAMVDREVVHSVMYALNTKCIRARVVDAREDAHHFVVAIEKPKNFKLIPLVPRQQYLDWKTSTPTASFTKTINKITYEARSIKCLLGIENRTADQTEELHELIDDFIELSEVDISRDMVDFRKDLTVKLLASGDDFLIEKAELMKKMSAIAGGDLAPGGKLEKAFKNKLLTHFSTVYDLTRFDDVDIEKIKEELALFPGDLYNVYKHFPKCFLARLFYDSIPREALWNFVSALAFVQLFDGKKSWFRSYIDCLKSTPIEEMSDELLDSSIVFVTEKLSLDPKYGGDFLKLATHERARRAKIRYQILKNDKKSKAGRKKSKSIEGVDCLIDLMSERCIPLYKRYYNESILPLVESGDPSVYADEASMLVLKTVNPDTHEKLLKGEVYEIFSGLIPFLKSEYSAQSLIDFLNCHIAGYTSFKFY